MSHRRIADPAADLAADVFITIEATINDATDFAEPTTPVQTQFQSIAEIVGAT